MIAFHATDESRADDGSLGNSLGQNRIGIACQQVSAWSIETGGFAKLFVGFIDIETRSFELRVDVHCFSIERYRLAVERYFHIGIGPSTCRPETLVTIKTNGSRSAVLDLLTLQGDNLLITVIIGANSRKGF